MRFVSAGDRPAEIDVALRIHTRDARVLLVLGTEDLARLAPRVVFELLLNDHRRQDVAARLDERDFFAFADRADLLAR